LVLRRILLCGLLLAGCVRHAQPPEKPRWASQERLEFPVADTPHRLTPLMERELRGCFDFFWNEVVDDPSLPTYGLHAGDYVGLARNVPISIEAHGFYLAMIPAGVERGWVSREQGRQRALTVLKSIKGLKNFHGFYYHFIDPKTGLRGWNDSPNVEVTNAGTATMIAGALAAGEYFGGEVQRLAEELYARIDWRWFLDPKLKHFYLACYPEDAPKGKPVNEQGFLRYHWAAYSEHIIMYVLAAGAPNPQFATNDEPYYAMRTRKGRYKGEDFIYCASGAAFTYQWTHCFVDFRNIVDRKGRNWFENSRRAALAARQFAIDMAGKVKGLGPNSWGMTASMSPTTFYSGRYGSLPAGSGNDTSRLLMDGTVAPCGAIGFVVFTPKESIAALEHMYTIPGLVGKYGLYDAYSFHTKAKGGRPWVGATYLGIDKGVSGLMLENYATQLIWKLVHASPHVQRGLKTLGFRRAEGETSSIQRQGARHLIINGRESEEKSRTQRDQR